MRLCRRKPLIGLFLPVGFYLCRLKDSHVAAGATLLALVALPPVLTDAFAATFLAVVALPPVLAKAAAAAFLASSALPPVLAETAAAALLALAAAAPAVLADAGAAALLAPAALSSVRAGHLTSRPSRLRERDLRKRVNERGYNSGLLTA